MNSTSMGSNTMNRQRNILLFGDALALALVTLIGFARHGTLSSAGVRFFATYLPMLLSWLLVAPFLGAYDPSRFVKSDQLWRPFWSMVLAAPMGGFLRGVWLSQPVPPTFVFVVGGFSAIGIIAWRTAFWFLTSRRYG